MYFITRGRGRPPCSFPGTFPRNRHSLAYLASGTQHSASEACLFMYRVVGDKDATATSTCTPPCARPAMNPPCNIQTQERCNADVSSAGSGHHSFISYRKHKHKGLSRWMSRKAIPQHANKWDRCNRLSALVSGMRTAGSKRPPSMAL